MLLKKISKSFKKKKEKVIEFGHFFIVSQQLAEIVATDYYFEAVGICEDATRAQAGTNWHCMLGLSSYLR